MVILPKWDNKGRTACCTRLFCVPTSAEAKLSNGVVQKNGPSLLFYGFLRLTHVSRVRLKSGSESKIA